MTTPPNSSAAEMLARLFHETYERLAPQFGYETRPETRQFDPQSKNGQLMIAVCDFISTSAAGPESAPRVETHPVSVDIQGVLFGKYYWVSHETITGCVANLIPQKHPQYWEWVLSVKRDASLPPATAETPNVLATLYATARMLKIRNKGDDEYTSDILMQAATELSTCQAELREAKAELDSIAYGHHRGREALKASQRVTHEWYTKYEAERKAREETTIAYNVAINECKLANASTLRERTARVEAERRLKIAIEKAADWNNQRYAEKQRAESAERENAELRQHAEEMFNALWPNSWARQGYEQWKAKQEKPHD